MPHLEPTEGFGSRHCWRASGALRSGWVPTLGGVCSTGAPPASLDRRSWFNSVSRWLNGGRSDARKRAGFNLFGRAMLRHRADRMLVDEVRGGKPRRLPRLE